jgi:MIP family channel proteins
MKVVRRYLAELIATFLVVFVAAGAVIADVFLTHVRLGDSFGPLGIVAAYGLAVAIAMLAVMPVSGGHVNPAITVSAFVARRISAADAAGYLVAQLLGAVLAAFVLKGIAPKSAFQFASGGVPGLAQGITIAKGSAVELVLGFFLAFAFWAVCIDERGPRTLAPFAVGAVIALGGLAGAAFTGAAMNPARWLGPAVASGQYGNWLVWVAGPLLGALLGSLAYETLFMVEPAGTPELAGVSEPDDIGEITVDVEEEGEPPVPAPADGDTDG